MRKISNFRFPVELNGSGRMCSPTSSAGDNVVCQTAFVVEGEELEFVENQLRIFEEIEIYFEQLIILRICGNH
uniref:Uncharacterized protein n=1 Tax=Romanomermis culicivorax TaxID=13658 RepID=A0A915JJP6_ROMCU